MLMTFVTTLKVLARDKRVLLWAIAFPLVLTTLFYAMFSNLDESYTLDPLQVLIVEDANYQSAESFSELIEELAHTDANNGSPLLNPSFVASADDARQALADGNYLGYLVVDDSGNPTYFMDTRRTDGIGNPSQTVITSVLDRFEQDKELVTALVRNNPMLLLDEAFLGGLSNEDSLSYTERISVTQNPPSDSQRYYYAVLAFSTIMMTTIAVAAVEMILGNTSPLGARRSLGGQSKIRTLVPTLGAAWLLSFACILLGFIYQRFVFGIDFGGKEAAVVLTLAVSAVCATFFGALLGALPIPSGAKGGLVTFFSCFLSLFAGLYGPFSQNLGDFVARELPVLSSINPVRQVADALFSLYYYDGYGELAVHLLSLLALSAVFFIISTLMLRRQRYASL